MYLFNESPCIATIITTGSRHQIVDKTSETYDNLYEIAYYI